MQEGTHSEENFFTMSITSFDTLTINCYTKRIYGGNKMEKKFDVQIIDEALRQNEVSTLKTKAKLLDIGSKFILILERNMDSFDEVPTEVKQLIQTHINEYQKTVEEYERNIKSYKSLLNNTDLSTYLNNWMRNSFYKVAAADKYIEDKFTLKELEKEK